MLCSSLKYVTMVTVHHVHVCVVHDIAKFPGSSLVINCAAGDPENTGGGGGRGPENTGGGGGRGPGNTSSTLV